MNQSRTLEPLGTFTALGILNREWDRKGRALVEIPTPFGTFIFNKKKTSPETALKRLCRRLDVPAMTVANWLKDWKRQPLDQR